MSVFDSKTKKNHIESKAFLDPNGGVQIQRFDTLKYKHFDKLTDKQLIDALDYAYSKSDSYTDWEGYMDYCHDYLADLFNDRGQLKEIV